MITDTQCDMVDKMLKHKEPIVCTTPNAEEDLLNEDLRAVGWLYYAQLPRFRYRRVYESSLWVAKKDGRCIPELYALALLKYNTLVSEPFWTDGDCTNNIKENVSVDDPGGFAAVGKRPLSKYGVRSTTKTYRKRYYSDPKHKAAQRASARRSAKKKRDVTRIARQVLEQHKIITIPKKPKDIDDQLSPLIVITADGSERSISDLLDELITKDDKKAE